MRVDECIVLMLYKGLHCCKPLSLSSFVTMKSLELYLCLFISSNMVAFTLTYSQVHSDGFNLFKDALRRKTADEMLVDSDLMFHSDLQIPAMPSVVGRFSNPLNVKRAINRFKNLKIIRDPLEFPELLIEEEIIDPNREDLKEARLPFPRTVK
uniref:Uncharacterized protein n=1 Tax=Clastoptera arizonana TaxID=38151 RepID=A0A1B6CTT1_9HEMI